MIDALRDSLAGFGVEFDVWFSERSMHESGAVDEAIEQLREQGHVYDSEGAVWLRTTDFGDDKDRVLIRSSGEKTYFASDAAYYLDKRGRGFDRCVYMLGADHHGYVGRLRTIVACAGDNPDETLEVLIGQLVKLVRNGEEVKMSKRAGTFLTLDDLVELVGVDAARYSLARWSADTPLTLDIDEITRRSNDNPVFYVQYAHARTCNAKRNAEDVGIGLDVFVPELLTSPFEAALLAALAEFPRVVATAAELRAPHRVARYLEDLAGTYHRWYDACRISPKGDDEITDVNRTRRVGERGDPHRARQRVGPARGQRTGADVAACLAMLTPPGRGTATYCPTRTPRARPPTSTRSIPTSGRCLHVAWPACCTSAAPRSPS